jgi:endonuclease/exonuclease/phosphatase (EEP) superfamily protein YafD
MSKILQGGFAGKRVGTSGFWPRSCGVGLTLIAAFGIAACAGDQGQENQVGEGEAVGSIAQTIVVSGPALLLGDLNISPGSALLGRIRAAGFHDGRASALGPTYSSEGLTTGRFTGSGWHLDHVLVRGLNAATSRILDEPRTLEVAGRQVRSTLSDHAGLLSIIEP